MIDWILKTALLTSVVLLFVALFRSKVRRLFGAHVSYMMWVLVPLSLIFYSLKEKTAVIISFNGVNLLSNPQATPVFTSPYFFSESQIDMMLWIWGIGMALFVLFRFCTWGLFNYKLMTQRQLYVLDEQLVKQLKWRQKLPKIYQTSQAHSPFVTGLIKPKIYLPSNFDQLFTTTEKIMILIHELTHVKRKDLFIQLLAEGIRSIYWFNPLVYLLWNEFTQDQEMACDRTTLLKLDKGIKKQYAQALKVSAVAHLIPNTLTFFNHKYERYIMLNFHNKNLSKSIKGTLLILFSIAFLFFSTQLVFACADPDEHGNIISYNFNEVPAKEVVQLIAHINPGEEEITDIQLLDEVLISAKAEEVYAFDFLQEILMTHGIKFERKGLEWKFTQL